MTISLNQATYLSQRLKKLNDKMNMGYTFADLWLVGINCSDEEKNRFLALYYGAIAQDTTPEKRKENCLEINKMAQRIISRATQKVN